jgi:predicted membrane protein
MAKKSSSSTGMLSKVVSFVAWLTGVIVALAVGFALIDGGLAVPGLEIVNEIAGWIVVVATILGAILAIIDALK